MSPRSVRGVRWLGLGVSLLVLAITFFLYIAHRDRVTLDRGAHVEGEIVGFIQPAAWDFFDFGRLIVRYSLDGEPKTAKIWIDNELADYSRGQQVQLFVRGDHVRTEREPNDPAPYGTVALIVGIGGLAAVVRGVILLAKSRHRHRSVPDHDASAWSRWSAWNERVGDRAWPLLWWFGVPLFAGFMIPILLSGIGPAYEARTGGTSGTFIAHKVDCGGKGGCFYTGDFRSGDGSVNRHDVGMASGSKVSAVGDEVPAVDTGDSHNVFPPGGGWDWLIITVMLAGTVAVALGWVYKLIGRIRGHGADLYDDGSADL